MTSQQIHQYLTLTWKTPIPKLLFLIKSSTKILKIWWSCSLILLILSPWEASCINREKVIKQFLRKLPASKKRAKFDLSDLLKWPLGWFNQIHIFTMHWYHPKEATCQKRQKVIKQFLRNQAFNWKVDDGRRRRTTTDDGRIGIRKAPLPFGWRS